MLDYKEAGVDIDAGAELVERIKPLAKSTFGPNVIGGIGSFSGAFALPSGYKEPVLLAATDGVGTKLKLAIDSGRFETIGVDLVAMCVNDLICNFAEPMFFLDYYATGKLNVHEAEAVIKGIAEGCKQAECSLIGGETAEMPGLYSEKDFDLAGFSVGIAERAEIDRSGQAKAGDVLIALPSSGLHSNGYSLARKLLFDKLSLSFDYEIDGRPLIDILLDPTNIYVKSFKANKSSIKALAHITGGGILENLPRTLPNGVKAVVQKNNIRTPEIFKFMSRHVEEHEMMRTFNMGVGMVLVVNSADAKDVAQKTGGYEIGYLEAGEKGVALV